MTQNKVLSENWWKVSKDEEFKKNKNLKSSDVNIIQDWLKKQPHLPLLNDNQVIMFLRASDYSLELTKTSIDLNYTMRTKLTEFFTNRNTYSKKLEAVMEYFHFGIIPVPVNDDCIIVCKIDEIDFNKFNAEDAIKYCFMFHDITHLEFGSVSGYIYIIDLKYINLTLLLRLPLSVVGNMMKFWQESATYRIKAFHVVNGGHIFKRILQVFQQFLNSEFLEMIHIHDNYENLKKQIDINNLPSDYEGHGKSVEELQKEVNEYLKRYSDWFVEEETQRIDEKKRSRKSVDHGLQGSFRKLNFD